MVNKFIYGLTLLPPVIYVVLVSILFLFSADFLDNAMASKKRTEQKSEEDWPKTKAEAVAKIVEKLSEEDKQKLKFMNKKELIKFHHSWGRGIRNSFGLT